MDEANKLSTEQKTYISFPMGDGIKRTQKLYKEIMPDAVLAPHTSSKNIDVVFTKVNYSLLQEHTFGVVACSLPMCPSGFIVLARDSSLYESICRNTMSRNLLTQRKSVFYPVGRKMESLLSTADCP